jgi:DNA polymerase-3 subunit epsilon
MASILARLPISTLDADDAETEAYLSALSDALADGRIVGDEARILAELAGSAGLGAAQVAALNQQLLESLRDEAFADGILTATELRQLRRAARALAVPDYFDDLTPDPEPSACGAASPAPSRQAPRQRRCGHCRTVGHYRSTCPQLAARSDRADGGAA